MVYQQFILTTYFTISHYNLQTSYYEPADFAIYNISTLSGRELLVELYIVQVHILFSIHLLRIE